MRYVPKFGIPSAHDMPLAVRYGFADFEPPIHLQSLRKNNRNHLFFLTFFASVFDVGVGYYTQSPNLMGIFTQLLAKRRVGNADWRPRPQDAGLTA